MATEKEVVRHLKLGLKEVDEITPWYDEEVSCWMFSHPLYPTVECGGDSLEEVKQNYPLYLREFIEERLANNLSSYAEEQTSGKAGIRSTMKRQKKEETASTKTVRLPEQLVSVAKWLKNHPEAIDEVHKLMRKYA